MNQFFYTLLLRCFKPLILKLLDRKAKKAGGVWDIYAPERFGIYTELAHVQQQTNSVKFERPIWIHAVSMGETKAAQPFIRLLLDQGYPVLLTHMTATARALGEKQFIADIQRGQLVQAWLPYDLPEAAKGFFAHWKPRCGILIEREVWPNIVLEATQQKIPTILASARFSAKTAKQVKRIGGVLCKAYRSLTVILAQSHQDAERFEEIGLPKPMVLGNLKFDLNIVASQVQAGEVLRTAIDRQVIVIASTRDGEENDFIQSILNHKNIQYPPLYVIVPRHPERFAQVEGLLQKSSLHYVKQSDHPSQEELRYVDVLFGDTLGEMFFYYGLADIAIVAGSFGDYGGQNHIEACAVGVPVIVGPHTKNFEKSVNDALIEGAARRTENPESALLLAHQLLGDTTQLLRMGKAGINWLTLHQGVSQRLYKMILPYLD
ncbi:3-deoxy-D-manno-octulosonic acid transferase [Pelistega ratti]|uniref:3-deoxy-D-manno-octulosonic acid transferase n=1 Tax=Pelistega ratti TaxID=2652177 RepID=UPI00135C810A|nr:3-deoxy-D-manno-octulosonic acid transferase [Pelistega ratti]